MRFKLATTFAALLLSMSAHATLLVNGGAEAGNLSGWTVGGVSNPRVDDGSFDPGINPRSGSYMFSGYQGLWGSLTQNVLLPGLGTARRLAMSFWEQGLDQDNPSDDGHVALTYRAQDGSVIGTASSEVVDAHDGVWRNYQGIFDVPLSAYSVDYTMVFTRNFGHDLDAFFDDHSLNLVGEVPEPASWLIVGLGLAGMTLMRRRKIS